MAHIRQENAGDYDAVHNVIKAAFADVPYSDQSEPQLVKRLRTSDAFIPELSLVAEIDGRIVGHILLTKIQIKNGQREVSSLALAPVSVHPSHQGQGIGGALIHASHDIARTLGHQSIILLGHEDYYPRFGYRRTADFGISLPFEAPPENCMVIELEAGSLSGVQGIVQYPAAFME